MNKTLTFLLMVFLWNALATTYTRASVLLEYKQEIPALKQIRTMEVETPSNVLFKSINIPIPFSTNLYKWVHELIDWSQVEVFQSLVIMGSGYTKRIIDLNNTATSPHIETLLQVLEVQKAEGGSILLYSSGIGKKRFYDLCWQLDDPVWYPVGQVSFTVHPYWSDFRRQRLSGIDRIIDRNESILLVKERVLRDKKMAQRWIDEFELFPKQYKDDLYLAGYARLYALILRLNWDDNLQNTRKMLLELKENYTGDMAISLMADWYRVLLDCYTHPEVAKDVLLQFSSSHPTQKSWVVVKTAKVLANKPIFLTELLKQVFYSPLRQPNRLARFYVRDMFGEIW